MFRESSDFLVEWREFFALFLLAAFFSCHIAHIKSQILINACDFQGDLFASRASQWGDFLVPRVHHLAASSILICILRMA